MKNLLFITLIIGLHTAVLAQIYPFHWAKALDLKNENICSGVTSSGDIVILSLFSNTVDFDNTGTAPNLTATSGFGFSQDICIVKYTTNGALSWAIKIGNSDMESINDIAIDKDNNIIISGKIKGVVDFNPAVGVNNIGAATKTSTFLAKYNTNGSFVWAKAFSGDFEFKHLTTDASGQIIAAGKFLGTVDFNPNTTVTNNLVSATNYNYFFVASYNIDGSYSWAKSFGNGINPTNWNGDAICGLTVDVNKNIYLLGTFSGVVDFNPSPTSMFNLTAATALGRSMFFSKLKADGSFVFAKAITGSGIIEPSGIAVDKSSNIIISGLFYNKTDFDPNSGIKNLTPNIFVFKPLMSDIFLAQYSSTGNYKWAKKLGNGDKENVVSLQLTQNDNIILFGKFIGSWGLNSIKSPYPHACFFEGFYRNNGTQISLQNLGYSNILNKKSLDLVVDKTNNQYYKIGEFNGTMDFGNDNAPGGPSYNLTVNHPSIFIVKRGLPTNVIMPYENNSDTRIFEENSSQISNLNTHIYIYPNPANDFINIEYNGFENTNTNNIKIYDITGKEISNYSISNNNNSSSQINISNFESGIYIITIQTQDKVIREKFIKH